MEVKAENPWRKKAIYTWLLREKWNRSEIKELGEQLQTMIEGLGGQERFDAYLECLLKDSDSKKLEEAVSEFDTAVANLWKSSNLEKHRDLGKRLPTIVDENDFQNFDRDSADLRDKFQAEWVRVEDLLPMIESTFHDECRKKAAALRRKRMARSRSRKQLRSRSYRRRSVRRISRPSRARKRAGSYSSRRKRQSRSRSTVRQRRRKRY